MDKEEFERIEKELETPNRYLRGVPNEAMTEIILTEDDVRCVVGRKIKSGGRHFTATEVTMYAQGIGDEIIGNAMRKRNWL